jgi:tetratricopeptide (TPR) repeat protein
LDIAETQFNSGVKAINHGKFREAIILLQPLAKRYPNWWQAAFNLSVAYFHLDENTKAKEILTKVAELHPDLPEVFCQQGLCYLKQGETEQAAKAFYRARELAPENTTIQQVIAELPKEFQR